MSRRDAIHGSFLYSEAMSVTVSVATGQSLDDCGNLSDRMDEQESASASEC